MSTGVQIPDIQLINLTLLLAIYANVNRDPAAACYQFNLRAEDVSYFKDLGIERIQSLVASVDQCLFTFRKDLLDLLAAPPGLAGVLAAVRQCDGDAGSTPLRAPTAAHPLPCPARCGEGRAKCRT